MKIYFASDFMETLETSRCQFVQLHMMEATPMGLLLDVLKEESNSITVWLYIMQVVFA